MAESDEEFTDRVIEESGRARRLAGIGAPPDWERKKAEFRAEQHAAEAADRADLVARVRVAVVSSLQQQDRAHPGFSAQTTVNAHLFAVHGILGVTEVAEAAVEVLQDWLRSRNAGRADETD